MDESGYYDTANGAYITTLVCFIGVLVVYAFSDRLGAQMIAWREKNPESMTRETLSTLLDAALLILGAVPRLYSLLAIGVTWMAVISPIITVAGLTPSLFNGLVDVLTFMPDVRAPPKRTRNTSQGGETQAARRHGSHGCPPLHRAAPHLPHLLL